jgi:hypothetical protein
MGALGLLCLVALRRLQPRPGVCVLAGAVAIFLKVFTLGGFYPGPIIGIGLEAVLVEAAFLVTASRAPGAVLGGALSLALNPLQMVLMTWLVAGGEAIGALDRAAAAAAGGLGLYDIGGPAVLAGVVVASGLLGALAGALSWRIAGRVLRRLGRTP